MIMKRWRVGTLTMGVILTVSGILLMISLIARINILYIFLNYWPVVLVLLGIEVLLHLFVKKDEGTDVKLRYDVLSVLFIGFILFISVLFYIAAFSIEMLGNREDAMAILGIRPHNIRVVDSVNLTEANELFVFNGSMNLKVINTADPSIKVDYVITAHASDLKYASETLESAINFEQGERAYMMANYAGFGNNNKIGYPTISCVIHLPQDKTLDISQFRGRLEYDGLVGDRIILP